MANELKTIITAEDRGSKVLEDFENRARATNANINSLNAAGSVNFARAVESSTKTAQSQIEKFATASTTTFVNLTRYSDMAENSVRTLNLATNALGTGSKLPALTSEIKTATTAIEEQAKAVDKLNRKMVADIQIVRPFKPEHYAEREKINQALEDARQSDSTDCCSAVERRFGPAGACRPRRFSGDAHDRVGADGDFSQTDFAVRVV